MIVSSLAFSYERNGETIDIPAPIIGGPAWSSYKFGSPMAEYIYEAILLQGDDGDDYVGDGDLGEGAARYGRRVLTWDCRGAVWVDELADAQSWRAMSDEEREASWAEYVATYLPWALEDDDENDDAF